MSLFSFLGMKGNNRRAGSAVLDPSTGYAVVEPSVEHDIHQGNAWGISIESLGLTLNQTILLQISTGDNEIHIPNVHYWADAEIARTEILANVDLTTGTTAVVPVNRTQNADNVKVKPDDLLFFSDPTGALTGDLMEGDLFGGGTGIGQTSFSGTGQSGDEFILAKNSDNLIRVTNLENAARNFLLGVFLYRNVRS